MKTDATIPGQPNFDRVGHLYRWAEWLLMGPLLSRTRRWFVPQLADRTQALVIGDGDGRFLAHLMSVHKTLRAEAVDISAQMLRLLRARVRSAGAESRLETAQVSALQMTLRPETDLVITHFVLDCLTPIQVEALAQQMATHLRRGTVWVVSDFAIPQSKWLRLPAALFIRTLYAAFWALTGLTVSRLPDIAGALAAAGFVRIERKEFVGGLLYTELWRLE